MEGRCEDALVWEVQNARGGGMVKCLYLLSKCIYTLYFVLEKCTYRFEQ